MTTASCLKLYFKCFAYDTIATGALHTYLPGNTSESVPFMLMSHGDGTFSCLKMKKINCINQTVKTYPFERNKEGEHMKI